MRLRKLLQTACGLLGLEARPGSPNMVLLFRCANLVLADIADRHIDFRTTEIFNVENNKVEFVSLNKNILRIRSVTVDGRMTKHDLYFDFITVPNGKVRVEYSYVPAFKSHMESIPSVAPGITESVMLYGILTEYCAVAGLVPEHRAFQKKYDTALFNLSKTGRARMVASVGR